MVLEGRHRDEVVTPSLSSRGGEERQRTTIRAGLVAGEDEGALRAAAPELPEGGEHVRVRALEAGAAAAEEDHVAGEEAGRLRRLEQEGRVPRSEVNNSE